jgi:hypothetical protein
MFFYNKNVILSTLYLNLMVSLNRHKFKIVKFETGWSNGLIIPCWFLITTTEIS